MALRGVLRTAGGTLDHFFCPGCKESHTVDTTRWAFNENYERPTFSPSVLVRSGHHSSRYVPGAECWCTYNASVPEAERSRFKCYLCHSFVTDGQIRFLEDSTHDFAGRTVPLEPFR